MPWSIDARIPLRFGSVREAVNLGAAQEVALLIEGDAPAPGAAAVARFALDPVAAGLLDAFEFHAAACACCVPRRPVTLALQQLFVARARGQVPFFHTVVGVPRDARGEAAIRAAVIDDPVASARYRLAT